MTEEAPLKFSRDYLIGFLDASMKVFLASKHTGAPQLHISVHCQSGPLIADALYRLFECGKVYADPWQSNPKRHSYRWRVQTFHEVHSVLRNVQYDLIGLRDAVEVALEIAILYERCYEIKTKLKGVKMDKLLERELRQTIRRIYDLEPCLEAAKRGEPYDDSILLDPAYRWRDVPAPRLPGSLIKPR